MPSDIRWLEIDEVCALNALIVAESGEPHGVRDPGLLDSGMARAAQRYAYEQPEPDLWDLAVILLFGIAQNHAFVQGNKRTGFKALLLFLELNGYELTTPDHPMFAKLIIEVINGEMSAGAFTRGLSDFVEELPEFTF